MKKLIALLLITTLLLSGCSAGEKEAATSEENTEKIEVSKADAEEEQIDEEASESETSNTDQDTEKVEPGMEVFAELPDEFYFSSGAGAWGTELHLEDDGTFSGLYHDSDMGDTGTDYPNGTCYISDFKGKFTAPQKKSDYVYSTTIEYINVDREGEEYIEDGIKYIVSGPYGLEDAGEILIYLYGTPSAELAEEFISWTYGDDMGPDDLRCYGLYNVNAGTGFTGSIIEEMSEIRKLEGKYVNDAGDELVLILNADLEEYDFELGSCEWTPHDGEKEVGNLMKNKRGGFSIYLDESIEYSFEIINYDSGSIEFKGVDWSEGLGTFVMQ